MVRGAHEAQVRGVARALVGRYYKSHLKSFVLAFSPMIASIAYDHTGSYDGFLVAMSLILLASGLALFRRGNVDALAINSVPVANPSST